MFFEKLKESECWVKCKIYTPTPHTQTHTKFGEIPERSNGADCKSVGEAFGGSNPPLPTRGTRCRCVFGKGCGCDCGIKIIQRTNVGILGIPSFLSRWTGSNRRQADYKSAALPAELHRHLFVSNRCTQKKFLLSYFKFFSPGTEKLRHFQIQKKYKLLCIIHLLLNHY